MTLLDARSITKRFAGIRALHDVSLSVDAAEFVGLIGPNGAGKTTLFDCLNGNLHADGGRVVFEGTPAELKANSYVRKEWLEV